MKVPTLSSACDVIADNVSDTNLNCMVMDTIQIFHSGKLVWLAYDAKQLYLYKKLINLQKV